MADFLEEPSEKTATTDTPFHGWSTFAPFVTVLIAAVLAGMILQRSQSHLDNARIQLEAQMHASMQSTMFHVQDCFERVFSIFSFIRSLPGVQSLDPTENQHVIDLMDQESLRYLLSEIYIIEQGFDGTHQPFLGIEPGQDESEEQQLDDEVEEYQVQMEMLDTFNTYPDLTYLISRPISLNLPDQHLAGAKTPGIVCAAPLHDGEQLVGLISGMIATAKIEAVLERGNYNAQIMLINDQGDLYSSRNLAPLPKIWFSEQFKERGVTQFFGHAADQIRISQYRGLWTPVEIGDQQHQWYITYLYDEDRLLNNSRSNRLLGDQGIAGIVFFTGLAVGLLIHTLSRRLSDRAAFMERQNMALSNLKASQTQLQAAKFAAENANRSKSEFLANMSHEIRTPMNGILGMAQIVETTDLSADQRQYINIISSSAENLLRIINEILDLSRVEMGSIPLEIESVALEDLCNELHGLFNKTAQQKNIEFNIHLPSTLPIVRTDRGHLRQILVNLIGNAIKFTEQGAVTLRVQSLVESFCECRLAFHVSDTGIGIPADKQSLIFEEFKQVDGSHTRKYGGTGLGLAISKKMVDRLGGKLQVASTLNEGSTFTFELSLATDSKPRPEKDDSAPVEKETFNLSVLLAEDNRVNQLVATKMLTGFGCRVEVANNGQEAVNRLRLNEPEADRPHFDLILMDVQMPVLDGLKATALIRSQEKTLQRIPIIAVTAHAMNGDREVFLDAGMDDYISKPIHREDLHATLKKYNNRAPEKKLTENS